MYELTVKFDNNIRVEVYDRLVEVTDRMAVIFFQKGGKVKLEVEQIEKEDPTGWMEGMDGWM